MNRKEFLKKALFSAALLCSCSQKEKPRYEQKECPFCRGDGDCLYCGGTSKCSYCNGTGTRNTQTSPVKGSLINKVVTPEECPFCNGTGKCHYCTGSGKCHVCKGTGELEQWKW